LACAKEKGALGRVLPGDVLEQIRADYQISSRQLAPLCIGLCEREGGSAGKCAAGEYFLAV